MTDQGNDSVIDRDTPGDDVMQVVSIRLEAGTLKRVEAHLTLTGGRRARAGLLRKFINDGISRAERQLQRKRRMRALARVDQ